jgi:hypothetical protein
VQARYRGSSSPDLPERVLSALPYLLPFLDSLGYGRFLFFQYPMITRAIAPLAPLISLYSTVPFAPFVAFLGVYIGIINNQRWPRFVRFNAMQVRQEVDLFAHVSVRKLPSASLRNRHCVRPEQSTHRPHTL